MEPLDFYDVKRGFARVQKAKIEPRLAQLDQERSALHRRGWIEFWFLLAIGVGIAITLAAREVGFEFAYFAVVISAIAAHRQLKKAAHKWEPQLTEAILRPICHHIGGLTYHPVDMGRFPIRQAHASGVFRNTGELAVSHVITGAQGDWRFDMAQVRFKFDDDDTKDFEGLLYAFNLPKTAPTNIAIHKDFGWAGNNLRGVSSGIGTARNPVDTGHSRFDQHFRMFAAHPIVAADFVPDRFLSVLCSIADLTTDGSSSLTAVFQGQHMFLAVRRKKQFMDFDVLAKTSDQIDGYISGAFEDIIVAQRICAALGPNLSCDAH